MTAIDEARTKSTSDTTGDRPHDTVPPANPVRAVAARLGRPAMAGLLIGVLTGLTVLLATGLRGDEYEARVGLLATPAASATGTTAQYGEVVSLTLPALVEVVRSPSVLDAAAARAGVPAAELGEHVAVELVPASGLARLSVRGESATQAGGAALALARSVISEDLLAPAGTLRLLDTRPDVIQVAPDWPLGIGLAIAAAAVAGIAAAALCQVHRPGSRAVRTALRATNIHHPVATARAGEPDLAARLSTLCSASGRSARVVAVVPALAGEATALADRMTVDPDRHTRGTAVIALTHRGRQDDLAAAVSALPSDSVLLGVVLV
jgi:hypothetical protein